MSNNKNSEISRRLNLLLFVFASTVIGGCATIPFDQPKESSYAITDTSDTVIARDVSDWTSANGNLSGFYPLLSGMDAFGARLRLIESAERSIDAQYFLMKNDAAGRIFSGALLAAADRGVRVRFLLDDVFTTANDEGLTVLDQHANIEVRLFNPIARSGIAYLNFFGDFKQANRRMHNKSFTVDNKITIVGGRNIADEYFELQEGGEFLDFDVIGIGPVAADVAEVFDTFWNHSRSVPLEVVADNIKPGDVENARSEIAAGFDQSSQSIYATAVNSPVISHLFDGALLLYPAPAEVITDDPEKLVQEISETQQTLVNHLAVVAAEADSEIIVVTPYFVPGNGGVAFWQDIAARGVKVTILTNSLASNNHIAVHSGYAKYRRPMLEAGVALYEMRANAVSNQPERGSNSPGIVTLHSKAVIVDREFLFVGSLNMDPRSIDINSEMGAVIRSPQLASKLADIVMTGLSESTYRVELDENGKLQWRGLIDGTEVIETSEPLASGWRRFNAFMQKIVPESQL